jgi:hypothetical protein
VTGAKKKQDERVQGTSPTVRGLDGRQWRGGRSSNGGNARVSVRECRSLVEWKEEVAGALAKLK